MVQGEISQGKFPSAKNYTNILSSVIQKHILK
ncbi:hypothetical protein SAMN05216556_10574 [Aequorivita viscosa]|nr:hypothetical protein SAMN05216556_10574 [Aequorivita viscosa]